MVDLSTDHSWLWSRNKFLNRKYAMQAMYQNFISGENWQLDQDKVKSQLSCCRVCVWGKEKLLLFLLS